MSTLNLTGSVVGGNPWNVWPESCQHCKRHVHVHIYFYIYIYKVYKTLEFTLITLFSWSLPLTLTSWHTSEEKIDCYRGYECTCAQLYLTLCEFMDCSPPGSSVHGTSQARILQWVAIPFSKDLPYPAIEPASSALQADSLPLSHQGIPIRGYSKMIFLNLFTWYGNCFVQEMRFQKCQNKK